MMAQCPMQKCHVSRFLWDNRCRLMGEESSTDTIFMAILCFDGSACAQVFVGPLLQMMNMHPMPSKASGHIVKSHKDFMHCEGVPLGLYQDKVPEEGVPEIIDLNCEMMVKDTWAQLGHPDQNPHPPSGPA